MAERALLMIPGPIEVSPEVVDAFSVAPPSHLAPNVIEAFGASLEQMRHVWRACSESQPFVIAGSGTLAMEMAAANVVEAGDRVLVVNTGYFSDRMAEMLRRLGADVDEVKAPFGDAPTLEAVDEAMLDRGPFKAIFATHVDTSSGVRVPAKGIARLCSARGVLSVFDGVCATVGEAFEMEDWGADIYLTGSQKALGLPAGLALLVASPAALEARDRLSRSPAMSIDWHQWLPIMKAYEARKPSYFATPATNLLLALDVALRQLLEPGMSRVFERHQRVADAMRAAWDALGLKLLAARPELAANTLSAIQYPDGVGPALTAEIKARGVVVAGGLMPGHKQRYFRVGHMGYVTTRPEWILKTVTAVEEALSACGHPVTPGAAVDAATLALG